jgi:hypothetical protein
VEVVDAEELVEEDEADVLETEETELDELVVGGAVELDDNELRLEEEEDEEVAD